MLTPLQALSTSGCRAVGAEEAQAAGGVAGMAGHTRTDLASREPVSVGDVVCCVVVTTDGSEKRTFFSFFVCVTTSAMFARDSSTFIDALFKSVLTPLQALSTSGKALGAEEAQAAGGVAGMAGHTCTDLASREPTSGDVDTSAMFARGSDTFIDVLFECVLTPLQALSTLGKALGAEEAQAAGGVAGMAGHTRTHSASSELVSART